MNITHRSMVILLDGCVCATEREKQFYSEQGQQLSLRLGGLVFPHTY